MCFTYLLDFNWYYASCRIDKMYLLRPASEDSSHCSDILIENQVGERLPIKISQIEQKSTANYSETAFSLL